MKNQIDTQKENVDFLIENISGTYYGIKWNATGKIETIRKRELVKIQKQFTWMTDF